MPDAISLTLDGHRTFFKWHRARRHAADPVFTARRIVEGLKAGASVEVDLVLHADAGFAVLHDPMLDRETTGTGPVRQASAATLRRLNLRDEAGSPIEDRVMLLEDLADLIAREEAHPESLLQLDYKEDAAALDAATIATFQRTLGSGAAHFILSSGDAEAVRLLSEGVEGLRIGYDPCHRGAMDRLRASRDFDGFVTEAISASPRAEMTYLDYRLVLEAQEAGADLVAAFHAAGRRVDAYTIRRADDAGVAAARRLLALRVDQITTDDPEGLGVALG